MATIYGLYIVPVTAELGYEHTDGHSHAVVHQIEVYRKQAWSDVQALQKHHSDYPNDNLYASADYGALTQVIAALDAYEKAHDLKGAP